MPGTTLRTESRDIVRLADVAPKHRVMGSSGRRVFGADCMSVKKGKDLTPKSPSRVKGGKGVVRNDNLTLVRAARPAKDLPPRKDVKGGRKIV